MTTRAVRLTVLLILGLGAGSPIIAANESRPSAATSWIRGIYVAASPSSIGVAPAVLWAQANARARLLRGIAVRGGGTSMQPLYQPGTVLVVAPTRFAGLHRGQTVVYLNEAHRQVAHVLVAKCKDGWRVAGLNNRTHDGEGVTPQNLVGVVAEAYHADPAATTAVARLD